MKFLYQICVGISMGILIGFLCGGIKICMNRQYSEKRAKAVQKLIRKAALVLKYITFLLLALGLVWCVFFLILGATVPAQTDYANNMAELIVSVLTVISIIFAFVEFLRRKDDKE